MSVAYLSATESMKSEPPTVGVEHERMIETADLHDMAPPRTLDRALDPPLAYCRQMMNCVH
jgi:hypothetical protein